MSKLISALPAALSEPQLYIAQVEVFEPTAARCTCTTIPCCCCCG